MPHNNFNSENKLSSLPTNRDDQAGRIHLVLGILPCLTLKKRVIRICRMLLPAPLLLTLWACVGGDKPKISYAPALPVSQPSEQTGGGAANGGAIYSRVSYSPLTSGDKAARVGDIITIILAERTNASKSNSANTTRDGGIGLTPPTTGPLALFSPSDVNASGNQSFNGQGQAAQSNTLSGEITVTVAEILANGVMRVRGEKLMVLNRGDEHIQLTGLIRPSDIDQHNRVLSTRVADARISYFGKGEIARASKQGWLQRFFSAISPF